MILQLIVMSRSSNESEICELEEKSIPRTTRKYSGIKLATDIAISTAVLANKTSNKLFKHFSDGGLATPSPSQNLPSMGQP